MQKRTAVEMQRRAETAVHIIKEGVSEDGPGMAYLIAHQGKTLVSGGIGKAHLEWNIPMTADTVSRLGSISKPITAIAILQLVEQGQLELDKPVATYAPNLPAHMGAATMRQILSHRSGIAEHAFDESLIPFIWQPMTTEKIIELQEGKPQDFEPGTKYEYVNFNYVLAAHVVEKVTEKSFVEFANQEIFAANNLHHSHYDQNEAIIPHRADFYTEQDGVVVNAAAVDMSHVSAAGALLSSANDMAKWAQLLVDGQLVNKATLEAAWTPLPLSDGTPTSYGLGFNMEEMAGERIIWHTGMTPGAHAAFELAPESEVFIILLSNGFHLPSTGKLADEMMMVMLTGALPESDN